MEGGSSEIWSAVDEHPRGSVVLGGHELETSPVVVYTTS